jgi:hypothetical protein
LIARAIQVWPVVDDANKGRYRFYTLTLLAFCTGLIALMAAEMFTDSFDSFCRPVTLALVAAFALFVAHLHSEGDDRPYSPYPPTDAPRCTESDGTLGAEEDQLSPPESRSPSSHRF